jgi:hypothetical protein
MDDDEFASGERTFHFRGGLEKGQMRISPELCRSGSVIPPGFVIFQLRLPSAYAHPITPKPGVLGAPALG